MMRRAGKFGWWSVLYALPLAYLMASLTPASYWYDAGTMIIPDANEYAPVIIDYDGGAKREFTGAYSVVVRNIRNQQVVCDASGGPFTYKPDAVYPAPLTLSWWAPSDARCSALPEGAYLVETCWGIRNIFWGLVPAKAICTTSNPFNVVRKEKGGM